VKSTVSYNTFDHRELEIPPSIGNFVQGVVKVASGTILGLTMLTSSVVAGGLVGLAVSFRNLPDVRILRNYVPEETSYIYDIKGQVLTRLHDEANREVVSLDRVSPHLKRAVLAIEDSRFYDHPGINPNSVARAFIANWEEGEVVEGGSTIAMQLVKNLFLSPDRNFTRKVAEAVLALRLEQILTKQQILELYLNQVYWGHNTYGVQTAAQSYFNKKAADLTLAESALMAGIIQAPEGFSPFINYPLAKERQFLVLSRMKELGWITAEEETEARAQPLLVGRPTSFDKSEIPYLTDAVVKELSDRFGKDAVLNGGMRVQTTIDLNFQRMAERVVSEWHTQLYYQGVFYNYNQGQIALVAVDPRTHFVKAMVGGLDFTESNYNRALMAQRQPGSAFKPFVYYTAFASGRYTPKSIVYDTKKTYWDGKEYYTPKNYSEKYSGPVSIRKALELSLNVPAVKIGQAVGLNKVIEVVRTLGMKSQIEPVISLPLGAVDLTPLEMASAFATFANNGWHSDPTFIVQVTDSNGDVLLDNTPEPQRVLDPWAVATLNDVLQGVINNGTGKAAKMEGRPAAGKTGTTSSERDIWFVGYVPQLSVAVWVGNDDYKPLRDQATGGKYVAPIWRDFMRQALVNEPVHNFRYAGEFSRPR